MDNIARVRQNYQVTLPPDVRKKLGIQEKDQVAFVEIEGGFIVKKVDAEKIRDFLLIDTKVNYRKE